MPAILVGALVLLLLLWALSAFTRTDPRTVVRVVRTALATAAFVGAALLAGIGRILPALMLGVGGLVLLDLVPVPWRSRRRGGRVSRVRSAFLEMELDHGSGAIRGRILAGRHEGAALDALEATTLVKLIPEIDEESRALLAAYLDRRAPGWREHAQAYATAGEGGAPRSGPMTPQEAYQVLGLEPGASVEDIGRAHRTLMKKLHPDQGGSTYLAARINEAKDVLLRRHR